MHQPSNSRCNNIVSSSPCVGSSLPKASNGTVYQRWIQLLQLLISHIQLIQFAWHIVLHQYIWFLGQLEDKIESIHTSKLRRYFCVSCNHCMKAPDHPLSTHSCLSAHSVQYVCEWHLAYWCLLNYSDKGAQHTYFPNYLLSSVTLEIYSDTLQ